MCQSLRDSPAPQEQDVPEAATLAQPLLGLLFRADKYINELHQNVEMHMLLYVLFSAKSKQLWSQTVLRDSYLHGLAKVSNYLRNIWSMLGINLTFKHWINISSLPFPFLFQIYLNVIHKNWCQSHFQKSEAKEEKSHYRQGREKDTVVFLDSWGIHLLTLANHFILSGIATTVRSEATLPSSLATSTETAPQSTS